MATGLNKNLRWAMLSVALTSIIWFAGSGRGQAQVITDITATPSSSNLSLGTSVAPPVGNTTVITGGTRVGTNLFHSFNTFSVGTNAVAQFQNSGSIPPPSVQSSCCSLSSVATSSTSIASVPQAAAVSQSATTANIFARVIGGQQSQIDGTIQTAGFGNANLWFMNPSGIVFGSHATLDIGGSAAFTTANSLSLRDSNGNTGVWKDSDYYGIYYNQNKTFIPFVFSTSTAAIDLNVIPGALGIHPIASFGFLASHSDLIPAGISITESNLSVPGQTLEFVAGNIQITGGNLSAPNGTVRMSSIAGPVKGDAEFPQHAFVDVDPNTGAYSYSDNHETSSLAGTITLAQSPNGADAVINAGSAIQLNGVTYNGTNATGYIGTDLTAGEHPIIVIKDGSLQVANLPSTQLIVSSPTVTSLSPDTTLDVGGNGPLTVTLNHAFIKDVAVQVKSDDANVASVTPAAVTVPAGSNSAPVTPGVRGVAPGTTSVKASAGATVPASALVNVTFPSSSVAPNPSTLTEGDGGTLIVTLVRPALENVTVIFTSSNPSVLKAPDPVQIPAQQASSIPVQFSTLQSGSATITASLQVASRPVGNTVSAPIQVHTVPLTSLAPNLSIIEANNGNLIVTLAKQPPHPVTVTFASSNPDAVPAPAPIIISPNQTSGAVTVQAQHPGATTITASYGTGTVSAPVVVTPPPITTFAPNLTVSSNTTGTVTITLAAPSSRDVRVVLDSSNTGVATLDPFVTIPAGQKSVTAPVHGLAAGTATIRASEGNSTASANVQVLDASLSNSVAAGKIVNPLRTQTIPVSYATQLIMASDRCVGGKNGEFSSFVKRGRDAAPLQPGGMLPSPLGLEDKTPKISALSRFPSSVVTRGLGTLNLASGVAAFLQRDTGC